MFDIWIGKTNLTLLILILGIAVVFPLQLLLCFKARSRTLRLLLPGLSLALLLAAAAGYALLPGWGGLLCLFGVLYAGFLLLLCAAAWGIGALIRRRRGPSAPQ